MLQALVQYAVHFRLFCHAICLGSSGMHRRYSALIHARRQICILWKLLMVNFLCEKLQLCLYEILPWTGYSVFSGTLNPTYFTSLISCQPYVSSHRGSDSTWWLWLDAAECLSYCTASPVVYQCGQWTAAWCTAVPLDCVTQPPVYRL